MIVGTKTRFLGIVAVADEVRATSASYGKKRRRDKVTAVERLIKEYDKVAM